MTASALLLGRLVEVLPASVLILAADRNDPKRLELAFANSAAQTRLALALAPGALFTALFPELRPEALSVLGSVLRGGEPRRLDCDALAPELGGGQVAVVRVDDSHVALLFDRPSPTAAQRELDKMASFLESIVENIPAMIFVKDAKTLRFELFNRAGEELLGIARQDLLGKSDADFFPEDQVSFFAAQDKTVLRMKELVDIPLEPIDTVRGRRWLHTKKIPILNDAGEASHLLGISLDVTARHRAEQGLIQARNELEHRVLERTAELSRTVRQLEQEAQERRRAEDALRRSEERLLLAQKMEAIGRLAGGIAHDFNNMLSVILGQVEIALSRFEPSGQLLESLHAIKLAATQSTKLTQQLLAFSRQQVVSPRLVDLNDLLKNLETILKRVIGDDVTLITSLKDQLSLVRVDPGQIEQVVLNMVINARDAMPGGGLLRIGTSEILIDDDYIRHHADAASGKHVVLSVADTGTGIDSETLKHIFDPFFTTKEPGRGTGLGLATAYGIVHRSGGSIAVSSELGKGTEFRIYLPAASDQQVPRHSTPPRLAIAFEGDETILIVEDEELVRKVARASLESFGYKVIAAADAYEALAICQSPTQTIDAVLTDIIMPGLTGLALAEELRRLRPEIRVLYMSGYTDKALIDTTALGPREAFIGKPFTPRALSGTLRELLDRVV